jgi:hypothetical protein
VYTLSLKSYTIIIQEMMNIPRLVAIFWNRPTSEFSINRDKEDPDAEANAPRASWSNPCRSLLTG